MNGDRFEVSRVLVIDDDPAFLRLVSRVVAGSANVTAVSGAAEAFELLRTGVWFDVIVCDLRMPVLGGFEVYEEIERHWPAQAKRVMFHTGGAYPHEESALRSRGRIVLRKPSSPWMLKTAIDQTMHKGVESDARAIQVADGESNWENEPHASGTRRIGRRESVSAPPGARTPQRVDGTYAHFGLARRRRTG